MKKIFIILAISLFMYGNGIANDRAPKFSKDSLNSNIIEHKWVIWKDKFFNTNLFHTEIYTLIKDDWILKCKIEYTDDDQFVYCNLP